MVVIFLMNEMRWLINEINNVGKWAQIVDEFLRKNMLTENLYIYFFNFNYFFNSGLNTL